MGNKIYVPFKTKNADTNKRALGDWKTDTDRFLLVIERKIDMPLPRGAASMPNEIELLPLFTMGDAERPAMGFLSASKSQEAIGVYKKPNLSRPHVKTRNVRAFLHTDNQLLRTP